MKRVKNISVISLIIFLIFTYIAISNAIEPQMPTSPLTATIKADLTVTDIKFGHCGCKCGKTDFGTHPLVRYSENLYVIITNKGNAKSAPCKLKIELYDNVGSKKVTIVKDVPEIAPNTTTTIKETGEYLWRIADGITATVDSTNVVSESNETNNTLNVKQCILYLI